MRSKQPRLVISFHTTAEAMATEKLCRKHDLEGKLISVPRSITSDCGLAWSAPITLRESIEALLQEHGVETSGFYEILL